MEDKSKKYIKTGSSYENIKMVIRTYLDTGRLKVGSLILGPSSDIYQVTAYGWVEGQPLKVYLAVLTESTTGHDGNKHLYNSDGEALKDPSNRTYFYDLDYIKPVLDLIEIGYSNEEK